MQTPLLCGDFSLIPVPQRQGWRDCAAKSLLAQARTRDNELLPEWRQQEQLEPARLYIQLQLEQGAENLSAIVRTYMSIEEPNPSYARTE